MRRRSPYAPESDYAFELALEFFVDTLDAGIDFDGWRLFRVMSESADSIRGAGITYLLWGGERPLELALSRAGDTIRYEIRLGLDDERGSGLTSSKRWNAVTLCATEGRSGAWTWSDRLSGIVECRAEPG